MTTCGSTAGPSPPGLRTRLIADCSTGLYDRAWAHATRIFDLIPEVSFVDQLPTRKLYVSTRYRLRVKKHDIEGHVSGPLSVAVDNRFIRATSYGRTLPTKPCSRLVFLWPADRAVNVGRAAPATSVESGGSRPWFTSGSLASVHPVRGSAHPLPCWFGRHCCA